MKMFFQVSSDSQGSSNNHNDTDCYIYPDLKTCLVGTFNEKKQAVSVRQARITGLSEEKVRKY